MLRNLLTSLFCLFLALSSVPCWAAPLPSEQEALARRLLNSQGCKACHKFEGHGTATGPSLEELGGKLDQKELYQALANPEQQHGNGLIPDFSHLRTDELEALVSFLHNLSSTNQKPAPESKSGDTVQAPTSETGEP